MVHSWPNDFELPVIRLPVLDRLCCACQNRTDIKDYKRRRVHLLDGPVKIVSQMALCPDATCIRHHHLVVAEGEPLISPPRWTIGWDVFAHIGHQRFSRHQSVPSIRDELMESYDITLSEDAIEDYIGKYQAILGARQRDFNQLREDYVGIKSLVLSIDGLKPEQGHDTLYTVRELNAKRVWFATPLLSSATEEILKLFLEVQLWVSQLDLPVQAWISDKQGAFVRCIQQCFPDVPHRYCQNHFLRDVAKPVLGMDSEMKLQLRKKARGVRPIERDALELKLTLEVSKERNPSAILEGQHVDVALEYCAAVRGVLNKSQGGPLDPPGLHMADGLKAVRSSIQKNIDKSIGGDAEGYLKRVAKCIDRALSATTDSLEKIPAYIDDIRKIYETLDPDNGKSGKRESRFNALRERLHETADPIRVEMARVMKTFEKGLFAGGDQLEFVRNNLDLERWFRLPKSHERRVHGRQHAGSRLVAEGPSLLLALDAHHRHRRPFTKEELEPYLGATPTEEEMEAIARRKLMRRAASCTTRKDLLSDLERRYGPDTRSTARSRSGSHGSSG